MRYSRYMQKPKRKRNRVNISITDEVYAAAQQQANRENRSVSNYIEWLILSKKP